MSFLYVFLLGIVNAYNLNINVIGHKHTSQKKFV